MKVDFDRFSHRSHPLTVVRWPDLENSTKMRSGEFPMLQQMQ
jgi:hypothetical protein